MVSGLTVGVHQAQRRGDSELIRLAERGGQEIEDYAERSVVMLRMLSQHPSLSAEARRCESVEAEMSTKDDLVTRQAQFALGLLQSLSPGRIGEVCLIANDGRELARVVHGNVARREDLSPDESLNGFFAPTLRTKSGFVFEASPYVSPDTGDLVVSYSMRLPGFPGPGVRGPNDPAVVHFEVSLDSFWQRLGERSMRSWIIDGNTGHTLADSRFPVRASAPDGPHVHGEPQQDNDHRFTGIAFRVQSATDRVGKHGVVSIDGQRYAFRAASPDVNGPNSWIVAVASEGSVEWYSGFGFLDAATIVAGLGLIAMGFLARGSFLHATSQANTDELTGLANRRALRRDLLRLVENGPGNTDGVTAALLFLDLDRFKEVNDTFGHLHGDQLLREVAQRLKDAVRREDLVVRLGGDELAIRLSGVSSTSDVAQVTDAIENALGASFLVNEVPVIVSASIGVAFYPADGIDPETLMRRADVAMYQAKELDVATSQYVAESDPYRSDRLELLADLRAAINEGGLTMHYQPVVESATGRVMSVEALARWTHPTRGSIPPSEFITIAESAGLVRSLTDFALRRSLTQLREWVDKGGLRD